MKRYDEYKQTGTPWIGEIPSHWECKRLRFICEFRNGYTPSKANPDFWTDGTIPWYRMEDIRDSGRRLNEAKQYVTEEAVKGGGLFEAGSFILATTATIGEHAVLIVDSLANQQFTNLKIRKSLSKEVDNEFFFYFLFVIDDYCKSTTKTATFAAVNIDDLKNFEVAIPPFDEQLKIVSYINKVIQTYDTVISTQERRIALLEELKQSVITEAVTHGINPDAKLRHSGIDWIGNIPEHWQKCRIKFIIDNHADGIWGDEEKGNEEDINCYRVADFDYDKMEIKNIIPTVRNISKEQLAGKLVNNGDLLLEKSGGGEISPVGRVVIANISEPAVCSNFIHFLHIKSTTTLKFLCYYFNFLYSNKVNLLFFNQTTGIQNLNIHDYLGQSIYLPPLYEQQEIVEYIESKIKPIDASIAKAKREIDLLKELKQSVITEAVTGKIKVC